MFYIILLGGQLILSMRIDAYELAQSRTDLFGYWFGFFLSSILALKMISNGSAMVSSILTVVVLLTYMSLVHFFTASSDSLISFLISRYGLLMWFVLGLGFSSTLGVLEERRNLQITKLTILIILAFLGLLVSTFSFQIIQDPVLTLSYQSVASSASILLLMFACILNVVWGRALPLYLAFSYISIATIVVVATVLLQSTGIFILWLGIVISFLGQKVLDSGLGNLLLIVIILIILTYVLIQSEAFVMIATTTRFASFFFSDGELSSLTSRLEILETFTQQFSVSPIFGHFKAQVLAGFDEGRFIHSLPLSFLTHTGLIGTSLICLILFNLLYSRNPFRRGLEQSESRLAFLFLIVLALGSISTFLTWSVFWFMLGVLCRRPAKKYKRNKNACNY